MGNDRYLTFALGKGRLANKTMELLEQIGISCEEMKDKDSRKLIFVNEELKLKFFLSKGPDVPTYVEYGAADIGVVGRDTIMEENRNVYEVLDLGCGTGQMTVRLAQAGYDMIGVDQSPDMLEIAQERKKGLDILYLMQDMREFELYGTVRAVISTCDSLNYMTTREDLLHAHESSVHSADLCFPSFPFTGFAGVCRRGGDPDPAGGSDGH